MSRRVPPPSYTHRCFVLVRAARQFLYHARFDPEQAPANPELYRGLVRAVLSRSPRKVSPPQTRISIPGYAGLRDFSQAHEALLKQKCGGAWRSYVLRSHWRMVFPVSRSHQQKTAETLATEIAEGGVPIVHVVRFPQLTINHGLLLFGKSEGSGQIHFQAYDPNVPEHPAQLTYDRSRQTFFFPGNRYWAGGKLDVIAIYRGWFY